MKRFGSKIIMGTLCGALLAFSPLCAHARDVDYTGQEISVRVNPGEPTQLQFPSAISGGFKRKGSSISLDRKDTDLIVFAQENLSEQGEVLLVRLDDGRSFSVRIQKATPEATRDDIVRVNDTRESVLPVDEEEPAYKEKQFEYAPATQVSGLMREMVLVGEFGKNAISGYRVSDRYRGQTILNDGTVHATIDRIFIGPNLWGYVIDATNLLDQTQKINPATFRLDGTRAVSASQWELAPKPMNVEQQVSGRDKTKVYIVTRAH